jgi:putative tributyrin esterase
VAGGWLPGTGHWAPGTANKELAMAFLQCSYYSDALGIMTAMNVILPQPVTSQIGMKGVKKKLSRYPVLYLLHGLSDDHSTWSQRTSIIRYASEYPLIVVMPTTGRGWYTDAVDGYAYESAIVKELPELVEQWFPAQTNRAGRFLAGLSMGGYGAMKLALKFPERYAKAVSHSGGFLTDGWIKDPENERRDEYTRIFGRKFKGTDNDIFQLARKFANGKNRAKLPKLRLDCGRDDFCLEVNEMFHGHLKRLKIPHQYQLHPGEHEWGYWDKHIQETLSFLMGK